MDIKENFKSKLQDLREETLEETSPSNKPKKNRAAQKLGLKAAKAGNPDYNSKIRADVGVKILGRKLQKMEEENLNEMHRKSKEAMDAIMDRVSKKHDEKWEKTKEKRTKEKLKGSEKTKEEDKERNNLGKRWKRAYLAKKKLKEEKINEISSGKANDAYHSAIDKLSTADIMASVTKGDIKKKWLKRGNKRHAQAVKFADYSDKKK